MTPPLPPREVIERLAQAMHRSAVGDLARWALAVLDAHAAGDSDALAALLEPRS